MDLSHKFGEYYSYQIQQEKKSPETIKTIHDLRMEIGEFCKLWK